MVLIHHAFRAQFGALPGLIRAVAANDTARAKRVGTHMANMVDVLHHHHAAEDEVLWPRLLERAPSHEEYVQQALAEHDAVTAAIDTLLSVRASWVDTADPVLREQLAVATEDMASTLGAHLGNEEQVVVPLIARWITPAEWQMFIDRGGAYVKPANLQFALAFAGFVLAGSTPEEQQRFIASVPIAPRMLLKRLGGRALKSYRAKVYAA
jgi:iron-sulfur cluster repair protein YtfE (RIC family)